jgi:hypothetical protein
MKTDKPDQVYAVIMRQSSVALQFLEGRKSIQQQEGF